MITVFTPTYNRAFCLEHLYNSLCNQSYTNFEWIVVDDGSTDETEELVGSFIKQGKLDITYKKQANQGKHVATNTAVEITKGELFFTVDSDDTLTPDALELVQNHWDDVQALPLNERKDIIGVSGHRAYQNGEVIGGPVPYDVLDCNLIDYRFRRNIKGDKAEVYTTDIMKKYPFPKTPNEYYLILTYAFYAMANDGYKLRHFDNAIWTTEYLEGGLTMNNIQHIKNCPYATLIGYAKMVSFNKIPIIHRMRYATHFWRFSFLYPQYNLKQKIGFLKNKWAILMLPLGYLVHFKDQ